MLKKRRRMSWDEYLKNLDAEAVELHPAVKKDDPYEKGYCDGFIKAWNAQAEMKERTCHFLPFKGEEAKEPENREGVCSECSHYLHSQYNYCPDCGAKVAG